MGIIEAVRSHFPDVRRNPKPEIDYDPIPPDARERALVLYERLLQEQHSRGRDNFEALDVRGRVWDISFFAGEAEGVLETGFFGLRRYKPNVRTLSLKKNHTIRTARTAETFTVYPWSILYLNFDQLPARYLQSNSEKTLTAAETRLNSLFPKKA
jgi:hypothetical protein